MMKRSTIVALAIAGFSAAYGSPCTCAAAYTYTSLDRPNKTGLVVTDTYAYAISGNTVVGTCFDAAGNSYGFSENNGVYTSVNVPNTITGGVTAGTTFATGISSGGVIVGYYVDISGYSHGFTKTGNVYARLDNPLALGVGSTYVNGISSSGNTIVGTFSDRASVSHGFSLTNGSYTTLDPSHSIGTGASGVDGNTVVGNYTTPIDFLSHGFSVTGGVYTTMDYGTNTLANGISGNTIVGAYDSHGFSETLGVLTTLDYPGATWTGVMGISGNTIVGLYSDANGGIHGFTAVPVPEPASFALLTFGGAGLLARRRKSA